MNKFLFVKQNGYLHKNYAILGNLRYCVLTHDRWYGLGKIIFKTYNFYVPGINMGNYKDFMHYCFNFKDYKVDYIESIQKCIEDNFMELL